MTDLAWRIAADQAPGTARSFFHNQSRGDCLELCRQGLRSRALCSSAKAVNGARRIARGESG